LCYYRQENIARKNAGEEPLPEEDPSNPIFKPLPEPSRLEGYLVTNQISSYCNHINGYGFCNIPTPILVFCVLAISIIGVDMLGTHIYCCCYYFRVAGQNFNRLYLMKALQEE
jgi:hypothetical protein